MLIHGGFNNTISGNAFTANAERHILYSDSGFGSGKMYSNKVSTNTFTGPVQAYTYYAPSPTAAANWATYTGNIYLNYGSSSVGSIPGLNY